MSHNPEHIRVYYNIHKCNHNEYPYNHSSHPQVKVLRLTSNFKEFWRYAHALDVICVYIDKAEKLILK